MNQRAMTDKVATFIKMIERPRTIGIKGIILSDFVVEILNARRQYWHAMRSVYIKRDRGIAV